MISLVSLSLHLTLQPIFLSFKVHISLLRSVTFLYRSYLKEQVCFLYRDLDYVSQRPMYVSFEDGEVTSACQVNDIACVTISNFHSWSKNLYGMRE